jgi:transmembrane sensor
MEKDNAKEILMRYLNGTCTEDEKALVETWYNLHNNPDVHSLSEEELDMELDSMDRSLPLHGRRPVYKRLMVAAAAVLVIGFTGWWLYHANRNATPTTGQALALNNTIVPGGNKAVLTLANGKKISLTDAGTGSIARETGISIVKTADGQMAYRITDVLNKEPISAFNTIETPVGGQYQVQLPDGTKVWLNAQSSLRFPVHFSNTERRVETTGEAYFEVAHDTTKPFRVVSREQQIEVLGTHFNINAYGNEPKLKTTLLEGSVIVKSEATAQNSVILKPGQQAVLSRDHSPLTIDHSPDLDDVVAWKNNKVQFTDLDIHSIMRMLERWYNIEVVFTGHDIKTTFGGSVSRSKNIDVILKLLEATGDVHFKIEGRRVTVMP